MVAPFKMADHEEKSTMATRSTTSTDSSIHPDVHFSPLAYITATTNVEALPDVSSPEEAPLAPQSERTLRRRIMSLELPVFLLFLGIIISGPVMLNQELYQTCVAVYHYNESDCEPLLGIIPKTEEAEVIENRIQPFVSQISMTSSILCNVWPGIVVLFVGPWSDKFGRRPVLLITFIAIFIDQVVIAILVSVSQKLSLNPWFYLLGSITSTLVGGGNSMMTVIYCYISDVTDMENKAKRMFYVEMAMGVGVVIANLLSSYLLRLTSVTFVCATSAALIFAALLYVLFFIGESLDVEATSFSHKAKSFFDVRLVKDLVQTCVARRPNYGRAIIGCAISISVVWSFILSGENGVFYLFLRNKFNVTLQDYTYYIAIVITIEMLGCGVAFGIFRKLLKISFSAIAMMGLAGCVLGSFTRALAQNFWQMYMASSFGLLSGITSPMLQAIVSLAVPSNEIGKVYSLTSCVNTLTPLAAAPLYTLVYNRTLNFYPGLFNFISMALYGECFVVMIVIYIFQRRVAKKSNEPKTVDVVAGESQAKIKPAEKPQPT